MHTVSNESWPGVGDVGSPLVLPWGEGRGARGEDAIERFAIPDVSATGPELPIKKTPRAIWPKCDCERTKQACIALADAIRLRLPQNQSAILAITSPCDGDGKTGLITALAPELSNTLGSVLVVDADFDRADLTARLSLLSDADGDSPAIYPTDFPGLSVVPMQIEQQERQHLETAWLHELRRDWPLTILDAVSLHHAEAVSLLGQCDCVCLVVRIGRTARRSLGKALNTVKNGGAQFLGCIALGEAGH